RFRRDLIGQSAETIAAAAGVTRPHPIRVLVVPATPEPRSLYTAGKLAPWLSMFTVAGEDAGLRLCRALLHAVGPGQTAVVHSTNRARVERFARAMPVGRILVNAPGAGHGCSVGDLTFRDLLY